jgi:CubicO group peptidase (beta-lactamase class C family)
MSTSVGGGLLDAALRPLVDGRIWALGLQAEVRRDGEPVVSIALGELAPGRPMQVDTLHAHICTLKPVTALAVLTLAERGGLDLARPLASFADRFPLLATAGGVLADVLCHDAGLVDPGPLEARLCPAADREMTIAALLAQDGLRRAAYSEYAGWRLLGEALGDATDLPANRWIQEQVLDPLGVGEDVRMWLPDGWFDQHLPRMAPYWDDLGSSPIPVLHDLVPHVAADTCSPGFGGYASAHGLATFYDQVTGLLSGRVAEPPGALPTAIALERALAQGRGRELDAVLDRTCDFAAGFMVGLTDHFFGPAPSDRAVGHGGWMGTSFALLDPEVDLTAVVVLNGLAGDISDLEHLRPGIVQAIYDQAVA